MQTLKINDYQSLHTWSINNLEQFTNAISDAKDLIDVTDVIARAKIFLTNQPKCSECNPNKLLNKLCKFSKDGLNSILPQDFSRGSAESKQPCGQNYIPNIGGLRDKILEFRSDKTEGSMKRVCKMK